ncbi:hypothetical protein PR048_014245 [Dryococelus australis]|uniref:Uncharacterized protein n=1 Tax=Dryococelus australis TaxID=614101 RepID=A0ABQ9HDM5_9NEOP|nr:hypothetical protein PR048_014245 [Dryococelus australis]
MRGHQVGTRLQRPLPMVLPPGDDSRNNLRDSVVRPGWSLRHSTYVTTDFHITPLTLVGSVNHGPKFRPSHLKSAMLGDEFISCYLLLPAREGVFEFDRATRNSATIGTARTRFECRQLTRAKKEFSQSRQATVFRSTACFEIFPRRCRRSADFLGSLQFTPPFHSSASPYSPQSLLSALKIALLIVAQISSLTFLNIIIFPRPGHRILASGNRAERCRWSAGFLGDLLFPSPFHSGVAPYLLQSTSSVVKASML